MQQFIYELVPVRPEMVDNPDLWTEDDLKMADDHFAYLSKATDEGRLILAGRSLDGKGPAVVIFEAEDEEAARCFMEADPFVSRGFATATVHPFRVALARK